VTYNGQRLYYDEQAPNFVPYPSATAPSGVPAALVGKTDAELLADYGLTVGGIIAPAGATINPPRIHGILGNSVNFQLPMTLDSADTVDLDPSAAPSYDLSYSYTDPATGSPETVTETAASPLTTGWNMLTRSITIDGVAQPRTFLVYNSFVALKLDPIADRAIPAGGSLTITLGVHDFAGATLTYSARTTITSTNPAATPARPNPLYQLKASLGILPGASAYNWGGLHEWWLQGSAGWYYLLPDGSLIRWNGGTDSAGHPTGTTVANVGTAAYADPRLLYDARAFAISASMTGNQLTVTPDAGFIGTLVVDVTVGDGSFTVTRSFTVVVGGG
jgi:hypothetical protein